MQADDLNYQISLSATLRIYYGRLRLNVRYLITQRKVKFYISIVI